MQLGVSLYDLCFMFTNSNREIKIKKYEIKIACVVSTRSELNFEFISVRLLAFALSQEFSSLRAN